MEEVKITFRGVELDVVGRYCEGEPMVMYYADGLGHPGSPPTFEAFEILVKGVDIFCLLDEESWSEIETLALDALI